MLIGFFLHLRSFKLPISTREFLTLLEALAQRVVSSSLEDFYTLARTTLIKDELGRWSRVIRASGLKFE